MRESLDRRRLGALDPRRLGAAKLAARRQRVSLIRMRVAAFSALVFALLWLGVLAQLVIGRDPALAAKARLQRRAAETRAREEARRRNQAILDLNKLHARIRRPPPPRHHHPQPSSSVADATPQAPAPAPVQSAPAPSPPPQPTPAPVASPPPPPPTPVVTSQS